MKTFIYHDTLNQTGRDRVEIKPIVCQTLGVKPERDYCHVALRPNLRAVDMEIRTEDSIGDTMYAYSMVFETVRFSTMKWIEEGCENGLSHGYYTRIDSYCYVPEGCRIDGAMMYEQGTDIYGYLNTVPLHRSNTARVEQKMRDMEAQLEILRTRPIMSEEQLIQMRRDWLDSRDHHNSIPKRLKDFDYFENDNDFKME